MEISTKKKCLRKPPLFFECRQICFVSFCCFVTCDFLFCYMQICSVIFVTKKKKKSVGGKPHYFLIPSKYVVIFFVFVSLTIKTQQVFFFSTRNGPWVGPGVRFGEKFLVGLPVYFWLMIQTLWCKFQVSSVFEIFFFFFLHTDRQTDIRNNGWNFGLRTSKCDFALKTYEIRFFATLSNICHFRQSRHFMLCLGKNALPIMDNFRSSSKIMKCFYSLNQ